MIKRIVANLLPGIDNIIATRRQVPDNRAVLVAISGIDASGKGYLTVRLVEALEGRGLHVANINIDGWLNLPHVRFDRRNPAEHFYLHAIRFEEMFRDLIFPLRDRRSLSLEMDYTEEMATAYRKHLLAYTDVDIILLEGIYLLKRAFQSYYDLSFWAECSFGTALKRAIARGQEGLPPDGTIEAYRKIYFPAQKIHFARDNPMTAASMIILNDPQLQ
jgi:uridine kinase